MSSDLKENIARMEQELADMKKQLEQQDKLELKGGDGYYLRATNKPFKSDYVLDKETINRGAFRATKELAEIADKNMVTRNTLEAYVHQIQGDGDGEYLLYTCKHGIYRASNKTDYRPYLGTVYMKKETAEILCKALNNGDIEL